MARNRKNIQALHVAVLPCGCRSVMQDVSHGKFRRLHREHARGMKCSNCGNLKVGKTIRP